MDFVSDRSWKITAHRAPPTARGAPAADDPSPSLQLGTPIELGGVDLAPWRVGQQFLDVAAADRDTLPVERASLVSSDPLMTALGRPNREQVMTVRQTTPTTLQALELTNGATLAKFLKEGAEKIAQESGASAGPVVDGLFQHTLSRDPTTKERQLAERLVGSTPRPEGIEDLLWALTMLPEFQLIY